jgi:uncharacterized membrane protein
MVFFFFIYIYTCIAIHITYIFSIFLISSIFTMVLLQLVKGGRSSGKISEYILIQPSEHAAANKPILFG